MIRFLIIALAAFLFLKAVQLYGQLEEKRHNLANYDEKIRNQMIINEALADQVENADDYLEQKSYEDGYFHPGQQVFQSDAG